MDFTYKVKVRLLIRGILLALLGLTMAAAAQQEEKEDPFKKWLEEDVAYIISAEEKDVFRNLTTEDEKLVFIEQFWRSRDPDPRTEENEFRSEHFRRIAYANDKFAAGKPGWKTDRGMIYIKFGPPHRRQTNPMGGRVFRSQRELISSDRERPKDAMTALPYEVWEYRYIDGIGSEVTFEFVSKDGTAAYKLALSPEEKDALPEETGSNIVKKRNRRNALQVYGGNPLDRLERYVAAFKPLPARPPQDFVTAQVHFDELPFTIHAQAGFESDSPHCDLAVEVPHRALAFNREADVYRALVNVEIFVRDVRKIVVGHRATELESRLDRQQFRQQVEESSVYKTRFSLPAGRYLFEIWIKDVLGNAASFQHKLVVVPQPDSHTQP